MADVTSQIEENLRSLVAPEAGDWPDVVSRAHRIEARRHRRSRRFLVVALASVAVVLVAGTALAVGRQVFGWFTVSASPEEAPTLPAAAPYVSGSVLRSPAAAPQQLAQPLQAALLGQDATLVVASPDGTHVAYHAWRDETPVLRILDTTSGADRILARGAQTLAWGDDGRIAYFQAAQPRYTGRGYVGHVVVRTLAGAPVTWTRRADKYHVLAWAGDRLLVSVERCTVPGCPRDSTPPGVYELDAAGRLAPLPLASVAALSPEGRRAFGRFEEVPGADSFSSVVKIVDVSTRRVLDTVDLAAAARAAGLAAGPVALQTATWREDEIVGTVSGRDSALFSFRVRDDGTLTVDSVLRVPEDTLPGRGVSFGTPTFVGSGTRSVVVPVRASITDEDVVVALLACDRQTRHCVRGRRLAGGGWFAVVTNPSRPLPGR